MICFGCKMEGHIERNCPNTGVDSNGTPLWCGTCDERTRHINTAEGPKRCPECNPNRHAQLKQHRKCPACHVTVYEWDNAPCGSHNGPETPDRRPERQAIEQIIGAEMENA